MTTELISLGILFLCAIIGGVIASKFKQPAVFGLLLVGAIIGPHSLNIVKDMNMITIMSDFGAILLLFIIGLEFDLSKLIKLGARSFLIGILKFAILLFFGYEFSLLLGLSTKAALFIGVILSFSSTVVVVKVLEQKEMFSRKEVPLLVAILVIEDIIAVLALTFFSGMKGANSNLVNTFERIVLSIILLILAYFIMMKLLRFVISLLLTNSTSDESVLAFLSLGIGALFSYFASYLGLTPTAGAFLAGSLIASLRNAKEYGRAIKPYALIFTSIFFISMGTLVDFKSVEANIAIILILLLVGVTAKFIAIGLLTYLVANYRKEQPFFSSIAMISVGEFSLLVAKESQKFGVGMDLVTITASIIFISAILMSISINYSEQVYSVISSKLPKRIKMNLARISGYTRRLFDQLEIENYFTNKLKTESKIAFMIFMYILLTLFILRKAFSFVRFMNSNILLIMLYIISAAAILFLLSLFYKSLIGIHQTLSVILTHVDSSRNLKKCTMLLNSMLIALSLMLSALLFPFAIFIFALGLWSNVIPMLLIILSFYYIKKVGGLIDKTAINESSILAAIINKFI